MGADQVFDIQWRYVNGQADESELDTIEGVRIGGRTVESDLMELLAHPPACTRSDAKLRRAQALAPSTTRPHDCQTLLRREPRRDSGELLDRLEPTHIRGG